MKYIKKLTDLLIKLSIQNAKAKAKRRGVKFNKKNLLNDKNLHYQLCIGMDLCGYAPLLYQNIY